MIIPLLRHNKMLRKTSIASKHQEIRSSCYYVLLIIAFRRIIQNFDADILMLVEMQIYFSYRPLWCTHNIFSKATDKDG